MSLIERAELAKEIAKRAGEYALEFFGRVGSLKIEDKGVLAP